MSEQEQVEGSSVIVELVVHGRTIQTSEHVLIRFSGYFEELFRSLRPLTEGEEEVIGLRSRHQVKCRQDPLATITFDTMNTLVQYLTDCYWQECSMQVMPDLKPVLESLEEQPSVIMQYLLASELFQIDMIQDHCLKHILHHYLTPGNCVYWMKMLGNLGCLERRCSGGNWKQTYNCIVHYIKLNFQEVMMQRGGNSDLCQMTSLEEFVAIISDEHLNVDREDEVYQAVSMWSRCHLLDQGNLAEQSQALLLFRHVQWELVEDFEAIAKDRLFLLSRRSPECRQFLARVEDYHRRIKPDAILSLQYWHQRRLPSRWPKLLVALSYAEGTIEAYDFDRRQWFQLTQSPPGGGSGLSPGAELCYSSSARRLLFVGGVRSKKILSYDPQGDLWDRGPDLSYPRVAHNAVIVDSSGPLHDQLWVMCGGSTENISKALVWEVEVHTFQAGPEETNELIVRSKNSNVASSKRKLLTEGRSFAGSCYDREAQRIYIVGGCSVQGEPAAEALDLAGPRGWAPIAGPERGRDSAGVAAASINGKVIAFGGFCDQTGEYLSSAEVYEPHLDRWRPLASRKDMKAARRKPAAICYRGRLFVVGGMDADGRDLGSVEVLNPVTEDWEPPDKSRTFTHVPPLRELSGWMSCCLVDKPLRLMVVEHAAQVDHPTPSHCHSPSPPETSTR